MSPGGGGRRIHALFVDLLRSGLHRERTLAQADVLIGDHLRFVFGAVEAVLGVEAVLDASEMERVFLDARADQVSQKDYRFYSSGSVAVTGVVEEYEPETIVLHVEGHRELERILSELVENARSHALRFKNNRDSASPP